MELVGYTDRLSVRQGETLKFMVSCRPKEYDVTLVRLIHGDTNPLGPGFKEQEIPSEMNRRQPGREQKIHLGSYVAVAHAPALNPSKSFTIQTWIWPTTPMKGRQGLVTKWEEGGAGGYALFLNDRGELAFSIRDGSGKVHTIDSGQDLRARTWYF